MKNKVFISALAICLALMFAGCAANTYESSDTINTRTSSYYASTSEQSFFEPSVVAPPEPAAPAEMAWGENNSDYSQDVGLATNISAAVAQQTRKIIHNYELNMSTDYFDDVVSTIDAKITEYNGYVVNKSISGKKPEAYGDKGRTADMMIRIPAQMADQFLSGITEKAEVSYVRDYADDITNEYYDVDTRLTMLKTQFDTLNDLMSRAESVEDIITIEARMSEVTYEIDRLTGKLRRYDELVDYATINIYISEHNAISGPASANKTTFERISEGFENNIYGVGVFFVDFFVWFVSSLPVIVILAIIVVGVIHIIKRCSKRRKAKKEAKLNKAIETNKTEQEVK